MTNAERQKERRKQFALLRQQMPKIPCECGCGALIPPVTALGKPSRYAHGHNPTGGEFSKGQPAWNKGMPCPWASKTHKGKKLPQDEIARRQATRLENNDGVYQKKQGWKHSSETIARMRAANQAKAMRGEENPFYGRTHTPESRAKMSAALSGEGHPKWKGGVGALPYGPEFTKKFKRLIRDRDKHTCQRCGKTREENGHTMHVHHIDHDKKHNDPVNLATVCTSCNVYLSYHQDEPFIKHSPST